MLIGDYLTTRKYNKARGYTYVHIHRDPLHYTGRRCPIVLLYHIIIFLSTWWYSLGLGLGNTWNRLFSSQPWWIDAVIKYSCFLFSAPILASLITRNAPLLYYNTHVDPGEIVYEDSHKEHDVSCKCMCIYENYLQQKNIWLIKQNTSHEIWFLVTCLPTFFEILGNWCYRMTASVSIRSH